MILPPPVTLHFLVSDAPFAVRVWGPGAHPGAVAAALGRAGTRHIVVILVDLALFPLLCAPPPWVAPLLQQDLTKLLIPLEMANASLPPDLSAVQQVGWDVPWIEALQKGQRLAATHTEVRVLNALLAALSGPDRLPCHWFVSHAKADGDAFARTVQHKLADYGLAAFYDASSIKAGDAWARALEQNAGRGMLIALQSDAYASRPWCQAEMLAAKRNDLPIIVGLMMRQGESRSFPHGGNLRTVALPVTPEDYETPGRAALILIAAALRETLHLDCWTASLDPAQTAGYKILSRPPEPARLVTQAPLDSAFLYPDPPLGGAELAILRALAPQSRFVTPLELL